MDDRENLRRSRGLRERVRHALDAAARLRSESDEIVRAIADTEEEIAAVQDELAERNDETGEHHRRLADRARRNASRYRAQLGD